jgi:DNA-binding MurR/RpiR family transcriptional regulator
VIAITSRRRSALADAATVALVTEAARTGYAGEEMAFRAAQFALVQALCADVGERLADRAAREARWAEARVTMRGER